MENYVETSIITLITLLTLWRKAALNLEISFPKLIWNVLVHCIHVLGAD